MRGRDKEVEEIIIYDRAVEVANLMSGKLDRPIRRIFAVDYINLPRKNLKSGKSDIKRKMSEVKKFIRKNFKDSSPEKLAKLYEHLWQGDGRFMVPLDKFMEDIGKPCEEVHKDLPLHSTVHISQQWGLQFEYPEMYLVRDVAVAYNNVLRLAQRIEEIKKEELNGPAMKRRSEELCIMFSDQKFNMRMCLICCFNLLEAYVNGIAWEFLAKDKEEDGDLSNNERKLLEGDQTSLVDKLIKIPKIVMRSESSPLDKSKPPLEELHDIIKPFRDSVVHASPFSAPEKLGGYDKLQNIYALKDETVAHAVVLTLETISRIHKFVGGREQYPGWMLPRDHDGFFKIR